MFIDTSIKKEKSKSIVEYDDFE
ncbi:unnamed protein product, partial [Rotaria magnacalcarata]